MAKIKKVDFYVSGKTYSSHAEYATDTGFFVKLDREMLAIVEENTPDEFADRMQRHYTRGKSGEKVITGKTEKEAVENWEDFIGWYIKQASVTEKVLLYKFQYKSRNVDSDKDDRGRFSYGGNKSEASLNFDFHICDKRTLAGKTTYFKHGSKTETIGGSIREKMDGYGWIEVKYTEETEQFFIILYKGMEDLMQKFTKFFGDRKSLLDTVSKQVKLLK